ncbi:MAG: ABC transporter ATP-binding protein [Archaeoglobaceae archaeon]|nr:ABC transporter ATP-binding protein [Archaeoglobaceae archaeon]MCX8152736.1 ABC transporter ATP-binding protein [Archaeoglobaceae archaeon]MDW8013443.1 ABC transporter ATP-binding protein [Archaeoglobaceae archaeon]
MVLEIDKLNVKFHLEPIVVKAVRDVSLKIKRECLALIGESGSGKSVLGMSILRILPENAKVEGKIIFEGKNLLELKEKEMRKIRGSRISWIPQNPATSLNPVLKVGFQVSEAMIEHGIGKNFAFEKTLKLFDSLSLRPAEEKAKNYPCELSGGMKQRVLVCMGISNDPDLIIADEPTKGIDVVKRNAVAKLFQKLKDVSSLLLITHDLRFAEKLADRVAVMYCGQVLEIRDADEFFKEPLHPYSKALLNSLPPKLVPIKGSSPSMVNPPKGCSFHERCDYVKEICREEVPNGEIKCWLYA